MDKYNGLYIHTMEYDLGIKKNEILIHGMIWIKFENYAK